MKIDNKNSGALLDLINWVKNELLSENAREKDPVPLFVIDEVTVELNFVLTGEAEGGFDIQLVKAGGKVGEERVQKVIVTMKPLVPFEDIKNMVDKEYPGLTRAVVKDSMRVLLKGRDITGDMPAPERD